jgi:hypothetical protein
MRRISRAASLLVLFGVLGLAAAGVAAAGTQTLVSGNGAIGGLDSAVSQTTGSSWSAALIVVPHPHWSTIAGTKWVAPAQGPVPDGGGTGPVNFTVHYRIAFTLPEVYEAPTLNGAMYSDNYADAFVNGIAVGGQPHGDSTGPPEFNFGWQSSLGPAPFGTADPAAFHAGTNFLSFDVVDAGNPQGLDFRAVVSYLEPTGETCKKGGWAAWGVFKNQGDCVSYVATHGTNPPAYG